MRKTSVVISGRNSAGCQAVREILFGQADLQVSSRIEPMLSADPQQDMAGVPDVLVMVLGDNAAAALGALASRASGRPALIVVGTGSDPALMRRAMQAGARDYFVLPVPAGELLQAVRRVSGETGGVTETPKVGTVTAVINAKGGSGASVVASSLAHISALKHKAPVALLDLDLQFGALPAAFDLEQRNSLLEALGAAADLDPIALQGYMGKHTSQVHLLSAMSDQMPLPWEIPAESLGRLLEVVRQTYPRAVVDLPRQIDPLTGSVLAQATDVVLVLQQGLTHLRDAKRMLKVMTGSLGVPAHRILLVVNRYSDDNPIGIKEIQDTIHPPRMLTLPNDFRAVSEALNSGLPIAEAEPDGMLTRALRGLVDVLEGKGGEAPEPARRRSLRETLTGRVAS